MFNVFSITFPIFAVIAIGYVFLRFGRVRPEDLRVLANFTMNLALPALVFNAVVTKSESLDLRYIAGYSLASLATLVIAYSWFRLIGQGLIRAGVATLGSCIPNSGLVGYPILLLAMPAVAQEVLALNVLVEAVLLLPLCLLLMSFHDLPSRRGYGVTVIRSLGHTLRRPLMIGLLLGMAVSFVGLPVPMAVTQLTELLGRAAAPLALFYIGGSLAGLTPHGNRSVAMQIVAMKLIVHPAMVAGLLGLAALVGAAPSTELAQAMVLTAAVPMTSSYAIFAAESGNESIASIALLGATVGAFLTLSLMLALLF